jgi:hypothetical protein
MAASRCWSTWEWPRRPRASVAPPSSDGIIGCTTATLGEAWVMGVVERRAVWEAEWPQLLLSSLGQIRS